MLYLNKDERIKWNYVRVHTKIDRDGHLSFILFRGVYLGRRWSRWMGRFRSGYSRIEIWTVVGCPSKSRQCCLLLRWRRCTKLSQWRLTIIVGCPSKSRLLKWRLTVVEYCPTKSTMRCWLLRWRGRTELPHWATRERIIGNGWWWNGRWLRSIVIVIKDWLVSWLTIDYAGACAEERLTIRNNTGLAFCFPTATHAHGRR